MENKLIPMTDFVLEQYELDKGSATFEKDCYNYANFLKQPLELWMFVPCDENNNVLEYPIDIYYKPDFGCQKYPQECYLYDLEQYEQAKERVLFEGLGIQNILEWNCYMVYLIGIRYKLFRYSKDREKIEIGEPKTIEDLVKYNLTLTETAKKQIDGN